MASRKKIKQPASVYVFQVFNYCFLTVLVLMCLYPMWYCLMASFSEPGKMMAHMGPLLTPLGFSVEAYKKVFLNPNIISGYKNTLCISKLDYDILSGICIVQKERNVEKAVNDLHYDYDVL